MTYLTHPVVSRSRLVVFHKTQLVALTFVYSRKGFVPFRLFLVELHGQPVFNFFTFEPFGIFLFTACGRQTPKPVKSGGDGKWAGIRLAPPALICSTGCKS